MLKTFGRIFALCALLLAAAVAEAAPLDAFKDLEGTLDIAGGTAHIPVMTQAAQDIMTFNPKVRITVAGGGSGVGVKQVGEGLVGIGNTGRPLKEKEVEQYGLKTYPFAIDGVALAVHPDNPVTSLTGEQVAKTFTDKLLGKVELAPTVNVVSSNGAMKTAIAQDPRAIGYVGIGHLDPTIAGVAIDGHVPSQENAASGEYPVVRQLFMNTKGDPSGLTAAFIDYIYSDAGAKIIEKSGYIPIPRPGK